MISRRNIHFHMLGLNIETQIKTRWEETSLNKNPTLHFLTFFQSFSGLVQFRTIGGKLRDDHVTTFDNGHWLMLNNFERVAN